MSPHTSGLNLRGPSWLSRSLRLAKVPELPKAVHPQFRTRNSRGKIAVEPKTHRPRRRQRQRRASTAGQQHRERLPFVLHHTNPPSPPPHLWFFFFVCVCIPFIVSIYLLQMSVPYLNSTIPNLPCDCADVVLADVPPYVWMVFLPLFTHCLCQLGLLGFWWLG
jgi:hypothetical protein